MGAEAMVPKGCFKMGAAQSWGLFINGVELIVGQPFHSKVGQLVICLGSKVDLRV